jgi:hypothetical protein
MNRTLDRNCESERHLPTPWCLVLIASSCFAFFQSGFAFSAPTGTEPWQIGIDARVRWCSRVDGVG